MQKVVATAAQQREVLRQIQQAETEMLPPGWRDDVHGSAFIDPARLTMLPIEQPQPKEKPVITKHRAANIVLAVVYLLAAAVVLTDVIVWRP